MIPYTGPFQVTFTHICTPQLSNCALCQFTQIFNPLSFILYHIGLLHRLLLTVRFFYLFKDGIYRTAVLKFTMLKYSQELRADYTSLTSTSWTCKHFRDSLIQRFFKLFYFSRHRNIFFFFLNNILYVTLWWMDGVRENTRSY